MAETDDELIRRLQQEVKHGEPPKHDPFLDLPMAKEVHVSAGGPTTSGQPAAAVPLCPPRQRTTRRSRDRRAA